MTTLLLQEIQGSLLTFLVSLSGQKNRMTPTPPFPSLHEGR
jgi:hypothetical protein